VVTMCRMVDFSEDTLRLRASSAALPALKNGSVVAVQFAVGPSGEGYRVRGKVLRQSEQGIVIRFAELYVAATDSFRRIDTFDVLEIKTGLLNPRG